MFVGGSEYLWSNRGQLRGILIYVVMVLCMVVGKVVQMEGVKL